jgi:tetratricopeptide (TPR) repeat protein
MGRIELHKSFLGSGYEGHIDVQGSGRPNVQPSLSWVDSLALQATASNSATTAAAAAATAGAVVRLGWDVSAIASAVQSLGATLGHQMDEQASLLERQAAELSAITEALRTPARTRAAERIADAGVLLRRGRFEQALKFAREAIDLSPITAYGFDAAAWALLGLGDFEGARSHFQEAADACDGDERAGYLRRAARLSYVLGDANNARNLIRTAVAGEPSTEERLGLLYDSAIYQAAAGDTTGALETIAAVCEADWRFGGMAAVDRALDDFPELRDAAIDRAALARRAAQERRETLDTHLQELRQRTPETLALLPSDDPWSQLRTDAIATLSETEAALAAAGAAEELDDRAARTDEAERMLGVAGGRIDDLEAGLAEAKARNRRPVEELSRTLPEDLVFLPREDPWRSVRAEAVTVIARIQELAARLSSAADPEPEEQRRLHLEIERRAKQADELMSVITEELPSAQVRNAAARQAFDQSFGTKKERRKRGFF